MADTGRLFVFSAPSGTGKTTLTKHILKAFENISYSVSYTTRSPRGDEKNGKDYFFIDVLEFKQKIEGNLWLEWAKVHDNYYGTSLDFVEDRMKKGQHTLLDIDVQGARQIVASDLDFVSIFIMPPSFEILKQRLTKRGTDSEEVIQKRLENAKKEMAQKGLYQYVIINDDLEKAIADFTQIIEDEIR
jgi:guanylate kinase